MLQSLFVFVNLKTIQSDFVYNTKITIQFLNHFG